MALTGAKKCPTLIILLNNKIKQNSKHRKCEGLFEVFITLNLTQIRVVKLKIWQSQEDSKTEE